MVKFSESHEPERYYCMCSIIACGLYYIQYPVFEVHFFVFKEFFFQKILSLCMVSIQERVMMVCVWYIHSVIPQNYMKIYEVEFTYLQ